MTLFILVVNLASAADNFC